MNRVVVDDEGGRWVERPDGKWQWGDGLMSVVTTWDKLQTILPRDDGQQVLL